MDPLDEAAERVPSPPGPMGLPPRRAGALASSAQQRAKVEGILDASSGERERRTRTMFETCSEPVREHKRRFDEEIRAALRPEQQRRFDAIAEEQSRRFFPRRDDTTETGKQ